MAIVNVSSKFINSKFQPASVAFPLPMTAGKRAKCAFFKLLEFSNWSWIMMSYAMLKVFNSTASQTEPFGTRDFRLTFPSGFVFGENVRLTFFSPISTSLYSFILWPTADLWVKKLEPVRQERAERWSAWMTNLRQKKTNIELKYYMCMLILKII